MNTVTEDLKKSIFEFKLNSGRDPANSQLADKYLLTETVLTTAFVFCVITVLKTIPVFRFTWILIPATLALAYLVPTLLSRREFVSFGLDSGKAKDSLRILLRTSALIFPVLLTALMISKIFGINLPLMTNTLHNQNVLTWLIYQLFYVAVAEELFFRGYLLTNIHRLLKSVFKDRILLQSYISIILSAVVFAAAHIITRQHFAGALTFLPGLVLGWLYIRTNALLAPILFHTLANLVYYYMTEILV